MQKGPAKSLNSTSEKSDYLLVRIDRDYKLKTNEQNTEAAQFRTDWQFLLVDKIDK